MCVERQLSPLRPPLPFIAPALLLDGIEKPLQSLASSRVCFCKAASQPRALLLSKTISPAVVRGARFLLRVWAAGPQSHYKYDPVMSLLINHMSEKAGNIAM